MIAYFLDRPYLILIFALTVALTVFVCIKAGQASAKRSQVNEKIIKKLKEENELRNEFAILTPSLAEKSEPDRLFKGVALNLQKRISDSDNMVTAFKELTQEQREIYALSFVIEDGSEKLSNFFRTNGHPLTDASLSAVKHLFGDRACEIFESEFDAFDPDNEISSVIPSEIDSFDTEFSSVLTENDIAFTAGNFIKENIQKFI